MSVVAGSATPQPGPAPAGQGNVAEGWSLKESARAYGMVIALAVVWLAFEYATGGVFLNARNFSNLMRQMAVTGVLSVGMLMVIVTAQIDLSVGSLVGLTGMVAALVQSSLGWGFVPTLLMTFACGLLIGVLQGTITAYLRVPAFIVTLGRPAGVAGRHQGDQLRVDHSGAAL